MRRGLRLPGFNRQTALSFIAGKPAPTGLGSNTNLVNAQITVGAGLPAMGPYQATLIRRPNTVVQRSERITPPKVNNPPTR
jgi:hypothetical protein